MNRDRLSRHLLIPFLLALGLYAAGYWFIEGRRTANSPWSVAFAVDATGHATLWVSQKSLGLGPVEIRFATPVTNPPVARTEMTFNEPRPVPFDTPVGRCVFQDTTFLPGTVALEVTGVPVQMLPRVLTIGTNEFPWQPARLLMVEADGTCHTSE